MEEATPAQRLEEMLGSARHLASQGSVYSAQNRLNEAKRFAAGAGLEIPPERIHGIEQNAYRLGIDVALGHARHCASEGSVYGAQNRLSEAKRFAVEIVGGTLDISQRVEEIEAMLNR